LYNLNIITDKTNINIKLTWLVFITIEQENLFDFYSLFYLKKCNYIN